MATAVEAVRAGAYDYVAKPFDQERLVRTVRSAAEQARLKRELGDLRRRVGPQRSFGTSPSAQKLERTIDLIAPQETMAVLLIGESGTGKEVVARAIHDLSPRR
ncbi:MAG: sigma 54-interacting transcriptional regulator, partial [Myxococcota bacterium]